MCGIFFEILSGDSPVESADELRHLLGCRGPDAKCGRFKTVWSCPDETQLVFEGSVLWLRGTHIQTQPIM